MPKSFSAARRGRRSLGTLLGVGVLTITLVACKDLLDVKNPNRVTEESLTNIASATAQANGLVHSVTRALTAILAPYSDATDEVQYVGSRDSYDQLDKGFVALKSNEFVDASWYYVAEARYMADATVKRLEGFRTADPARLPATDLLKTYIHAAVMYASIPDMFDDFVIPQIDADGRKVPTASIGHANIAVLYDTAIALTTRGLAMPEANLAANVNLRAQLLGIRARAKFSKGLLTKTPIGPWVAGATTAALVTDAQGFGYVADVNAALAARGGDWRLELKPSSANLGFPIIGNDLNNRGELRAGDLYVVPAANPKLVGSIRLRDPIDNILDPALTRAINSCCVPAVNNFVPITVISSRELYLLQAEEALSRGAAGTAAFQTAINTVRSFEAGLTPWTPASSVTALQLLQHERRVNLYLQGRRLADMYRFGFKDPAWLPTSTAFLNSGCYLTITQAERDPNPLVKDPDSRCQ